MQKVSFMGTICLVFNWVCSGGGINHSEIRWNMYPVSNIHRRTYFLTFFWRLKNLQVLVLQNLKITEVTKWNFFFLSVTIHKKIREKKSKQVL